ncbi:hypothetical protein Misp01_37760 [Microtetraspora sp. NBRC 13810]|uniref:hypothetical protein n=1 Tax=Microtetraspora sp. NBRC 13810 TaxID=3030990 RepID=UPI0024A202EA|nr:hypothetical protein [Microtetraspora sp. NBRC 13810]GLW08646.1 hypothetical protein Misp01_37760 [Microtetraspora sp. NBRC 13810]
MATTGAGSSRREGPRAGGRAFPGGPRSGVAGGRPDGRLPVLLMLVTSGALAVLAVLLAPIMLGAIELSAGLHPRAAAPAPQPSAVPVPWHTRAPGSGVPINDVAPEQCVDGLYGSVVELVTLLPCDAPHDGQLLSAFELPHGDWPGPAAVNRLAEDGCERRVRGRIAPLPDVTFMYVTPPGDSWPADRKVLCLGVHVTDNAKLSHPIGH